MKDWKIVRSKKGCHPAFGYPLGDFLCINEDDVKKKVSELQNMGVNDIEILDYQQNIKHYEK